MNPELHIHLYPEASERQADILEDFPYGEGQSILSFGQGLIVIDLESADDTSIDQEWYLNNNEDVQSFYIVDDDVE